MSGRVRLVDIADSLGITKVSVSKALRGHTDISEATRERVARRAEEMGYVADRVARSLSTQTSLTLGVVVPKVAHAFFSEVVAGVQEVAARRGYEIVLSVSGEDPAQEQRTLRMLVAMRVDGLLVSTAGEGPDLSAYDLVRKAGTPLVFFDRAAEGLPFSSVLVDDRGTARAAVTAAIRQGARTVAHLAGRAAVRISRERRAGYEDALDAAGLPRGRVVESGFDEAAGYHGLLALAQAGPLPDAVFCVTYPVALGALDALRERGLDDGPALVVFGTPPSARFLPRGTVCVDQNALAMGRTAAAVLFDEIDGTGPAGPRAVVHDAAVFPVERMPLPYLKAPAGASPATP